MGSRFTRDEHGNLVTKQAAFLLPVLEHELGYPGKRELCPKERPCPRLACKFHLAREDEQPGKPHAPKGDEDVRRAGVKVKAKQESCSLDMPERHPDGIGYKRIGGLLGTTLRRAEQIGTRAVLKAAVARALLENEDDLREKLPDGTIVQAVLHAAGEDPSTVLVTYVIVLDDANHAPSLARAGVRVRKKS